MDHKLAEETNTVDKYLLDELSAPERLEFEEHMFDCPLCAQQVKLDAIVIDNLKKTLLEDMPHPAQQRVFAAAVPKPARASSKWFDWLRPQTLVPAFAALALAAILGYYNQVLIPALLRPQVLASNTIASVARDAPPVLTVNRDAPMFVLNFDVDSPQVYPAYICEFLAADKGRILAVQDSGPRKVAAFTLSLLLSTRQFPAGRYTMILRPVSNTQTELRRYSFVIKDQDSK